MIRKAFFYFFIFLFIYFIIGGVIFNHLAKVQVPDFKDYLLKNSKFLSKEEGFTQEVKNVENDWVHLRVFLSPRAAGPPEHIHENFDEYFVVEQGTASILVGGKKLILKAGEHIVIPKGTPHKPFNETNEIVVLNDTSNQHPTMPCEFAYGLSKLYPYMDKFGSESPKVLLQLAALGNSIDTWVVKAPIQVQKTIRWLLGPTARLFGYGK
jgi:mannose-6-phosphate isomerase-like protein (cupin superfamily)